MKKEKAQLKNNYYEQRAKYQHGIWLRYLENSPPPSDPPSCGWLIENYVLHDMWMSEQPAPEAAPKLTECKSRKERTMSRQWTILSTEMHSSLYASELQKHYIGG